MLGKTGPLVYEAGKAMHQGSFSSPFRLFHCICGTVPQVCNPSPSDLIKVGLITPKLMYDGLNCIGPLINQLGPSKTRLANLRMLGLEKIVD
jgi:hypothetical protein